MTEDGQPQGLARQLLAAAINSVSSASYLDIAVPASCTLQVYDPYDAFLSRGTLKTDLETEQAEGRFDCARILLLQAILNQEDPHTGKLVSSLNIGITSTIWDVGIPTEYQDLVEFGNASRPWRARACWI